MKQTDYDYGIKEINGESIHIYDFEGEFVMSLQIVSDGRFASPHGTMPKESIGDFILKTLGHPSAIGEQ